MADDTKQEENLEEEVVDQTQEEAQVDSQESEELQEEAQETEQVEGEQETQEETQEETQQEETQEEPQPPSRREQLRIQKLLHKYPNLQERVAPQQQSGINYKDMIEADEQVYDQLDQASQEFGNTKYQEGVQTAQFYSWRTDLKIDTPQVYRDHPELDPKNEEGFNPALADTLNQMYLSTVGYNGKSVKNPDISYRDYIDSMYELVDEAASHKVERTQANIVKQAARTGLRPDGSSAKRLDLSKAPQAMTDEELDAVIASSGFAPKKR